MKITLPSGVVIESDEGISVGGVEIAPLVTRLPAEPTENVDVDTDADVTANEARELRLEEALLGSKQRSTLQLLREYESPVSVSHVSELQEITAEAAGQRLAKLVEAGLVKRLRRGIFQAVKLPEA